MMNWMINLSSPSIFGFIKNKKKEKNLFPQRILWEYGIGRKRRKRKRKTADERSRKAVDVEESDGTNTKNT